jgi:hypothetical protein
MRCRPSPTFLGYEHAGNALYLDCNGKLLHNPTASALKSDRAAGRKIYAPLYEADRLNHVPVRWLADHALTITSGLLAITRCGMPYLMVRPLLGNVGVIQLWVGVFGYKTAPILNFTLNEKAVSPEISSQPLAPIRDDDCLNKRPLSYQGFMSSVSREMTVSTALM